MVTTSVTFPKPVYEVLRQLTGESRMNVALPIALKDLVQFKIQDLENKILAFEQKYGMTFNEFENACQQGRIANPFSYDVEKDNWEWEAALTEREGLREIAQWLE
ncbi:MAG: hypothetical protein Q7U34_15835 [Anaerolineales bacterium]|nr:hypothetical protein [Anaerolineales bacterium]MDP3186624.1 hypothetical protein [Anaerolineales bacterium]